MDVLALGRHLVQELGLTDGTDTLGRWMAHHIAELINLVENASTEPARRQAQQQVSDTILRLWRHRAALPGQNTYPLKSLMPMLQVIERLHPSAYPSVIMPYSYERQVDELAAVVFDRLTRLVITLLLMKAPANVWSDEINPAAFDALAPEEQQVIIAVREWMALLPPLPNRSQQTDHNEQGINLPHTATALIDDAMKSLSELREALGKE